MLNARQREERTVIPNYVEEVVPHYNYREFLVHFRLQRTLVEDLAHRYGQSEFFVTLEGHGGTLPLNPWKQTLVFLWFVGHQTSSYRDVANRFGVGLNTLFRIISRFSSFLGTLGPVIIHLPSEDEKRQCKEWYQHNKGFPDIIGSLDGTHIRIDKPTTDPDSYINRKGYHSIQLQGLVNEKGKFMDVFVGYPGSVHDARVLRMSSLFEKLPRLCRGGGYIVGDSAYPCLQTLLVPYRDNGILTGAQRNFNRRLSSCRVTVEHAFGLLKQRFRQLYHLKLRKYERMLRVIYACCVLHNIADEVDLDVLEPPPQDAEPAEGNVLAAEDAAELINFQENGRNLRDEVCRQLAMVN